MDRQAFDTALGLSLKCAQGARAIFLESSKRVALNRQRHLYRVSSLH
jgi:hypothetical protein